MADPQAPVTGATPQGESKTIPSFSATAEASRDARSSELAELAGVTPAETKTPPEGATAPDTFDFDAEWSKVPERLRTEASQKFYDNVNASLSQEYGDVLPLLVKSKESPELREALKLAAKDDSFRDLLADPDFRKDFNKLTDKEQRSFLFGQASETYRKYAVPAEATQPHVDPTEQRLSAMEQRFQQQNDDRETGGYIDGRKREVQALTAEYPTLAQDQKFLGHVVEIAESRFESAAMRAGVKTQDNPGWPAQAIRAGVKPPSYLEAYQYQAEVSGRTAPPAAPATSPATPPSQPQAPRSAAEGKARAVALVKKAGGFSNLAAAASRKGR